jgi:anti-sigma factor (TIGR02949 family)
MHCEAIQAKLQAYLDGQLPPAEGQAVEAHLGTCEACTEDLTLLRQVDEALATFPIQEAPQGLTARIMEQVRAEPQPTFRLRWEDAVVSVAFAGAATALLSVVLFLWPQDSTAPAAYLQRLWWTWIPRLDRLWQAVQVQPLYAIGALSSLCTAAVMAVCAGLLARQFIRMRAFSAPRPRRS